MVVNFMVVSNALPDRVRVTEGGELKVEAGAGGLVTALAPVMKQGDTWAGYHPTISKKGWVRALRSRRPLFNINPVLLSDKVYQRYYGEFANGVLWPMMHSMPSKRTPHAGSAWNAYEQANKTFADRVQCGLREGEKIWVHDYHLMLLPRLLHDKGARLGYFQHIPWPKPEVFFRIPHAKSILEGLLGARLVGFHIPVYADNFLACVRKLKGTVVDGRLIHFGGQVTKVGVFPIGIDPLEFDSSGQAVKAANLRKDWGVKKVVLGAERLDYTKGIPDRILAFGRFLQDHPEWHGHVKLVQICSPSRGKVPAYQEEKKKVKAAVRKVNNIYGSPGWEPVWCEYKGATREELLAHYRAADICLVTPKCDGMNLVAKEYAVAGPDDGVLVLSGTAGAAFQLSKGAVMVNSRNKHSIASGLFTALSMADRKRRYCMSRLRQNVQTENIHSWAKSFQDAWDSVPSY